MPTDDAINRWLTEHVLGWKLRMAPTPDFLTWEGFGLLLTVIAAAGRFSEVSFIPAIGAYQAAVTGPALRVPGVAKDHDPRRALMLAAAKAYGYEEGA